MEEIISLLLLDGEDIENISDISSDIFEEDADARIALTECLIKNNNEDVWVNFITLAVRHISVNNIFSIIQDFSFEELDNFEQDEKDSFLDDIISCFKKNIAQVIRENLGETGELNEMQPFITLVENLKSIFERGIYNTKAFPEHFLILDIFEQYFEDMSEEFDIHNVISNPYELVEHLLNGYNFNNDTRKYINSNVKYRNAVLFALVMKTLIRESKAPKMVNKFTFIKCIMLFPKWEEAMMFAFAKLEEQLEEYQQQFDKQNQSNWSVVVKNNVPKELQDRIFFNYPKIFGESGYHFDKNQTVINEKPKDIDAQSVMKRSNKAQLNRLNNYKAIKAPVSEYFANPKVVTDEIVLDSITAYCYQKLTKGEALFIIDENGERKINQHSSLLRFILMMPDDEALIKYFSRICYIARNDDQDWSEFIKNNPVDFDYYLKRDLNRINKPLTDNQKVLLILADVFYPYIYAIKNAKGGADQAECKKLFDRIYLGYIILSFNN